jgi:hypothetical protein
VKANGCSRVFKRNAENLARRRKSLGNPQPGSPYKPAQQKEETMTEQDLSAVDRRHLITKVVPACSLACLWAGLAQADDKAKQEKPADEGKHKFDVEFEQKTTMLQQISRQNRTFIEFIKTLQDELDEKEVLRLLNINSANVGKRIGSRQAENSPDQKFRTFTETFRGPQMERFLTMEITEDTDKVFEIRATECIWAKVFRDAGLGGEIGHAAVCNMDYYWPTAFNPDFKMERTKTLMQGDDCCNHRYIDTT